VLISETCHVEPLCTYVRRNFCLLYRVSGMSSGLYDEKIVRLRAAGSVIGYASTMGAVFVSKVN